MGNPDAKVTQWGEIGGFAPQMTYIDRCKEEIVKLLGMEGRIRGLMG